MVLPFQSMVLPFRYQLLLVDCESILCRFANLISRQRESPFGRE